MLTDLLMATRSCRRFYPTPRVTKNDITALVAAARLCPSTANMQRLRFHPVTDLSDIVTLTGMLSFAGLLPDYGRPSCDRMPTAYLILATGGTPDLNLAIDAGLAAEAILLRATELGFAGCLFRSFCADDVANLPGMRGMTPVLVVALGAPAETIRLVDAAPGDSLSYYRTPENVHCVPKLSVEELIF